MPKLLYLDTETGGFAAKVNALLSVGATEFDPETGWFGDTFHSLIRPRQDLAISLGALQVNKLTLEQIQAAPSESTVWFQFEEWLSEHETAGTYAQNADFDYGFLQEWEKRIGDTGASKRFQGRPAFLCSRQLIRTARVRGLYPANGSTSLADACKHLGIEPGGHDALADAIAGAKVVCRLWEMFGWHKPAPPASSVCPKDGRPCDCPPDWCDRADVLKAR